MENRGLLKLFSQCNISETDITEWFSQFLVGLEMRIDTSYPNSVYYEKDDETLFELYDQKNGEVLYFLVHYDKIWSVFETKYGFNYNEIQTFIKGMVEDTLRLGSVTPRRNSKRSSRRWKTPLNNL